MTEPRASSYRPDIDGLRAVAVLSVIAFHLNISRFPGGFVGVDVFFVISGFLITKLIIDEIETTEGFNLSRFYERRARRLLPALLSVSILSFAAAATLFTAKHFSEFAWSSLATVAGVSNIYFWLQSGYFDTDAIFKPLLHTWSLGVEAQFYLVWPPMLSLMLIKSRRVAVGLALTTVFVGSLVASWMCASDGSAIFYLMPFRLFEFAIGAGLVWAERIRFSNAIMREVGLLTGLGLIAYSVTTFTRTMTFPSSNALIPCFGAALVIFCGSARFTGALLRNRAAVNIGLISYSLYLIHWPLIVFYHYLTLAPPNRTEKTLLLIASLVLATAFYLFIEEPFRRRGPPAQRQARRFATVCLAMVLLIDTASITALGGWSWRSPAPSPLSAYGGDDCSSPRCAHGDEGDPIYVLGDSFSRQLYDGLVTTFPRQRFIVFDVGNCTIFSPKWIRWVEAEGEVTRCSEFRDSLFSELRAKHAKIILANNWVRDRYFDADAFKLTGKTIMHTLTSGEEKAVFTFSEIEKLKSVLGLDSVLVVANPPSVGNLPDLDLCVNRPVAFVQTNCEVTPLVDVAKRRYLAKAAPDGIRTLDPFSAFCNESGCTNFGPEGPLYSDRFHLSKLGSRKLVAYFQSDIADWIGPRTESSATATASSEAR